MLTIKGTGCALIDYLYSDIRLDSEVFKRYRSKKSGDGGLEPGKLVFIEDLERFADRPFSEILNNLSGGRKPDRANIGGPSVVALIHAAQMLEGHKVQVQFYGARGNDESGQALMQIVEQVPLNTSDYIVLDGETPFTQVFSDPTYDNGHGERTFINGRGVADLYNADFLTSSFFDADIVAFGGTALVPEIHDKLASLCCHAQHEGTIVVVNTVYDFLCERKNPGYCWSLGGEEAAYPWIDVLIVDREEGMKLSGAKNIKEALAFFKAQGTSAAIITDGARDIHFYSDGRLFRPCEASLAVSEEVTRILKSPDKPQGDTTGCGDNFVGGVLASLALQSEAGCRRGSLDIIQACEMAIVSGGFACFYLGGTYLERYPGEKQENVMHLLDLYHRQRQG